jgi:NhaP-type Na+/H+ and K+/H+ antiporter
VPIDVLFAYAPLGILAGLSFIFLIRPLVVFISLLPWLINHTFKFNDLLFLSMIRETGIIAAVLLIISATYEIIQSNFVISVGMWVILLTLMIEPPLTPYLSRRIGVTK